MFLSPSIAAEKCPHWIKGIFEETGDSYLRVVHAKGSTWQNARDVAVRLIMADQSLAMGYAGDIKIRNDGSIVTTGNMEAIVQGRIIDECGRLCKSGDYDVFLLVQIPKNKAIPFYNPVSEKYPFSARVFVPGMAQIHKGTPGKGAGFITGETLFIGGIVAGELLRQSYHSQMEATKYTSLRKVYMDNARICRIVRDASIAGAIIIYVWNVFDGIMAKGQPHLVLGDAKLHFSPYATHESGGLTMKINF